MDTLKCTRKAVHSRNVHFLIEVMKIKATYETLYPSKKMNPLFINIFVHFKVNMHFYIF